MSNSSTPIPTATNSVTELFLKSEALNKSRQEAIARKLQFLNKASVPPAPTIPTPPSPPRHPSPSARQQPSPTILPPSPALESPSPQIRSPSPPMQSPSPPRPVITTLTLEIHSKNQFLIKSLFILTRELQKIVQSLSGEICSNSRDWILPIDSYQPFKLQISRLSYVEIIDIPRFVFQVFNKCSRTVIDVDEVLATVNRDVLEKLYPFQMEGVRYVVEKGGRALIGDEMGVGKTIQAIVSAYVYYEEWPVLVICPASIKINWKEEFLKWLPCISSANIYILDSKRKPDPSAKVWVASYSLIANSEAAIAQQNFQVVIADECHYLKNYNAKRTKAILPILQRARRTILLSGTPMISRPAEVYNILTALRNDLFKSFLDFANRYCDPKKSFNFTDYSGSANTNELYILLSSFFMIRRLKSEVLTQLPPKIRQKIEIPCERTKCIEIRKIYSELKAEPLISSIEKNTFVTKAYQLTASAKVKGVVEYVGYLIENDCKFLLFAHHVLMMDAVEEQVRKAKVRFIRIDGSTTAEGRARAVSEFQANKECKVAILSIMAAGLGLTLTAASTVVVAEMAWSPSVMIQAEDRAHRLGQSRAVNIHYLYGPGTLDEYIWPKIYSKLDVITKAIDNNENPESKGLLNPECKVGFGDFQGLFEDIEEFCS